MHPILPASGLWLVPLGVAAGAVLAPGTASPPAAAGSAVEMEVRAVLPLDDEKSSVVVLQQKGGSTLLPIFIGRGEANAIDMRIKKTTPLRPLTHDLLEKAIKSLGARLEKIEIDGV